MPCSYWACVRPCYGIIPYISHIPHTVCMFRFQCILSSAYTPNFRCFSPHTRTNQTTLEDISPFLLLRYLPPPHDGEGHPGTSPNPPKEHELSYKQRLLVKDAHRSLRVYDIGWKRNIAQVFGLGGERYEWVWRLWCGGSRLAVHLHLYSL